MSKLGSKFSKKHISESSKKHFVQDKKPVKNSQISNVLTSITKDMKVGNLWTPLMLAARSGNIETVKELLQTKDCDLNRMNKYGRNALMLAVENNRIEIVKALMEHPDIDPNIKDKLEGRTALMLAAIRNLPKIIEVLLLSEKVDPNIRDDLEECTALMLAT